MSIASESTVLGGGAGEYVAVAVPRRQKVLRFCVRHPRTPFFLGVMVLLFAACMAAPLLAPYPPKETQTLIRLQGPSADHLLGTDQLGRDTFSRLLFGGRLSLSFGLAVVAIAATVGVTLGVTAGYVTGIFDLLFGRVVDAVLAFPAVLLLIAMRSALGGGVWPLLIVVGLINFPGYYRLSRGQVLQVRENDYVHAARALGASNARVMFRHILPNSLNPLIIQSSFAAGGAVLTLSTLSFLGLGLTGGSPDWGGMFNDALNNFRTQPWLVFGPGIAVFASVLSFYVLGDDMRDALDPRDRGRRR